MPTSDTHRTRDANPYAPPRTENTRSNLHLEAGWIGPALSLGIVCWLGAGFASAATVVPEAEWEQNAFVITLIAAGAFCIAAAFARHRAVNRENQSVDA